MLFMLAAAWEKKTGLPLTIKLLIRVFEFFFLAFFLVFWHTKVFLKHVAKKAHPWYILTDSLC